LRGVEGEAERSLNAGFEELLRGKAVQWVGNGQASRAGDVAVAAAVEQAADAADGQAQGNRRREHVGDLPRRQVVLLDDEAIPEQETEHAAQEGTVEDQAALPEVEELG